MLVISNFFNRLRSKLSKPILFGIYGAIGCLLMAGLLGEGFLYFTQLPPSTVPSSQSIVMLIDTSGSMQGARIQETREAASAFVQRRDLNKDKLGVVNFDSAVHTVAPLGSDLNSLQTSISNLMAQGGTYMGEGIEQATTNLQGVVESKNILLFTDGVPDSQAKASWAAQLARSQKINLIAVATDGADVNYLAQLTGNPKLVFFARSGEFDKAFRDVETLIYSQQLVESRSTGDYNLLYSVLRIGGWTAILSLGLASPLIIGQNHYLRRRLLTPREAGTLVGGGILAGFVAGGMGQVLFSGIAYVPYAALIGGAINWGIVGAIAIGIISAINQKKFDQLQSIVKGGLLGLGSGAIGGVLVPTMGGVGLGVGAILFGIGSQYILKINLVGWGIGIAALIAGQSIFFPPAGFPSGLEIFGRLLGWSILGAVVGVGISLFIPNLKRIRGLLGGILGGSLGAIGFLVAAGLLADLPGRLLGALILGFCIGVMIFWEEVRQIELHPHLLVHWTPEETSKLLLGVKPILLGTSSEANISLSKADGFFPLTAKVFLENNKIVMEYNADYAKAKKMTKTRHELDDGARRKLGSITIEVKNIEKD
jgi:Ca-activated chloride channel homolog